MSSGRYAMRGWAFQGWAFRPWALAGGGVAVVVPPTVGWHATQLSRSVFATGDRTAVATQFNRCVVANPEVDR